MTGTPIKIEERDVFRLYRSKDKPGMQLTREEFNEMIRGTIAEIAADRIWDMSSGNIGVCHAIISFLVDRLKNQIGGLSEVTNVLDSMDLVKRISTLRGMPNLANFNSVIQYNELSTETQQKLRYFLDQVASGNEVRSTDSTRSPGSNEAVDLLTQYGFLHETEDGILQFASQMHHNVWLQSNRTDPDPGLLVDPLKTDFLIQSIKRMRASKLVEFVGANTNDIVRERQLQMELYRATCTCAPPDTVITPEWRVSSTNGFIDMRISNAKVNWFWEFLVNGDRAEEHSSRFMLGGKYSPVLTPGTKHVLIDFRQKTRLRIRRNEFIYVSFTEDYSECTVSGLPDGDRKITLEK